MQKVLKQGRFYCFWDKIVIVKIYEHFLLRL